MVSFHTILHAIIAYHVISCGRRPGGRRGEAHRAGLRGNEARPGRRGAEREGEIMYIFSNYIITMLILFII